MGKDSGNKTDEQFSLEHDVVNLYSKSVAAYGTLAYEGQTGNYTAGDRRSLSGPTLVAVVKSSDLRNYYDAPAFWLLYYSRLRSVLGQRQMSSGALVVGKITSQSSAQRSFIPHDDVV